MSIPEDDDLGPWLRGELSAAEERALRAAPPAGRAADVAAHGRTLDALRALARERAPQRDLFPEIAARIAPAPRRFGWPVAAAAALLLLAGLALLLRLQRTAVEPAPPSATPAVALGPTPSTIARSAYGDTDRALAGIRLELRRTIEERKDDLPPETRALVFENLRVIDQAIADIEAALDAAPADPDLARTYIAYRERQIDLLRQVNRMAAKL
jgi:hypothetical protein